MASKDSKSPFWAAAKKLEASSSRCSAEGSKRGLSSWTWRLAREASWRALSWLVPMISATLE